MASNRNNRGIAAYIAVAAVLILAFVFIFPQITESGKKTQYSDVIKYFDDYKVSSYTLDLGSGELEFTIEGEEKPRQYTVPNVSVFLDDTENYREKRAEALLALSTRLADKVTKTGKKFTLEPMNPYERRIIHSNLQDSETVTTYSVGSEPYRKVVIAPKNAKPYGKGGYKKDGYKKRSPKPHRNHSDKPVAEKTGSYTTTYKADFKPQQHKAEYKNFEDYLAGHSDEFKGEE